MSTPASPATAISICSSQRCKPRTSSLSARTSLCRWFRAPIRGIFLGDAEEGVGCLGGESRAGADIIGEDLRGGGETDRGIVALVVGAEVAVDEPLHEVPLLQIAQPDAGF